MKKVVFLFICIISFMFIRCDKTENIQENQNFLIGNWIFNNDSDSGLKSYYKSTALIENRPSITFKDNGSFTERGYSGRCGTPPISYTEDYYGTWERTDSIVDIKVKLWRGDATYKWIIKKNNSESLIVKVIKEEYK